MLRLYEMKTLAINFFPLIWCGGYACFNIYSVLHQYGVSKIQLIEPRAFFLAYAIGW